MSNQLPFYLRGRLEGDREHDRFGDVILSGDINGDGLDEWIISASTATYMEDEDGVNPIPHYYMGKVYVYSYDLKLIYTLRGDHYGDCFGSALALADLNGDGSLEIIIGAPRASSSSLLECGKVFIYSGRTGQLLAKLEGDENYARLGAAIAVLDWNKDGVPDIAISSHNMDPNGTDRDGRVTIFSGRDNSILEQWNGSNQEGLGLSLAAGDVDGNGHDELIISAPRFSEPGLTHNGRVLVCSSSKAVLHESKGKRSYDEHGSKLAVFDMDEDGIPDILIGSPKSGGEYTRGGAVTVFSLTQNKIIMEKEGWFGLQELGTALLPFRRSGGMPAVLAGSRVGTVYLLDLNGKLIHEFSGDEAEIFGQSLSVVYGEEETRIAVGAVSGLNKNRFLAGAVYFLTTASPAEVEHETIQDMELIDSGSLTSSLLTSPKKILLTTYWYLPHVGGVDVYVRLLKSELERRGHHVDVLAHHPDMAHYYIVDGEKIVNKWKIKSVVYDQVIRFYQSYLAHVDPWVRYRDIERYCFELAAVLFDLEQYDIIHTQDIISTRALSRVKPASTALVATIHGLLAKEHVFAGNIESKDSLAWKYVADEEYYGCVSADATILPTEWLRKEMSQFALPSGLFNIIPYGLDVDEFTRKTTLPLTQPVVKKGSFIICCPARLVPVKGHHTLIRALGRISSDNSWHCWLLGDGIIRTEVENWVQEAGLTDRISLLGDRNDVPALLKQSDVMVLPSLQDNLPFSIMEAQLAGIPVIASNAGGIPEMVSHGKTGLLFDTGNDLQLAQQLSRIISDPNLRATLSKQGIEWAKKQWSVDTLMERTLSVYDQALKKVRS